MSLIKRTVPGRHVDDATNTTRSAHVVDIPRAAPPLPAQPLHVRLRPRSLEQVVGHPSVVKALAKLLASKSPAHSFLFTGQSGAGKTTLARIVGTMLGCTERGSVVEIDAARYSGVDNMRDVILGSNFSSLSGSGKKQIIIDECHMLSKGAWNSLLLSIEEPPAHLFWAFCTTEPDKVPATIKTRCQAFDLKPIAWDVLSEYLGRVVQSEGLKLAEGVIDVVARRCNGSVRQALVHLASIDGIADKAEALRLIETVDSEEGAGIDLARMVCTGRGFEWVKVQPLLKALSDDSPEGVRLVVVNYAAKMLLDTKNPEEAERLLAVLSAFGAPYNSSERQAPLLLSVGSLLFGG